MADHKLTPWRKLDELADVLLGQERRLRQTLEQLHADVVATREYWDSATGECFRSHTGKGHRQAHLELAADRLHAAAVLARAAAQQNYLEQHGTTVPGGDLP